MQGNSSCDGKRAIKYECMAQDQYDKEEQAHRRSNRVI